jgi:hypothetical protein
MLFHPRFIVHDAADARYMKQEQRVALGDGYMGGAYGESQTRATKNAVRLQKRESQGDGALAVGGRTARANGSATADQASEAEPAMELPRTNCMSAALMLLQRYRL